MSFFPDDFDARSDVAGVLDLVALDSPDGTHRFIIGTDGVFTDANGNVWLGASVFGASGQAFSINGTAPEGDVSMSFVQPEGAPDLAVQVAALGAEYVKDYPIRFYVQPLKSVQEFFAPTLAPILFRTGIMGAIQIEAQGLLERRLSVKYETAFIGRNAARGWSYTTTDHARLTGSPNPSLALMPRDTQREFALWG